MPQSSNSTFESFWNLYLDLHWDLGFEAWDFLAPSPFCTLHFSLCTYLIPASLSLHTSYSFTVARTSRRQYSAISRNLPAAIITPTSIPVTPWLFGDSIPNDLQ